MCSCIVGGLAWCIQVAWLKIVPLSVSRTAHRLWNHRLVVSPHLSVIMYCICLSFCTHQNSRYCKSTAAHINTDACEHLEKGFNILRHSVDRIVVSLDLKNEQIIYQCAMIAFSLSRGRHKLIIWPVDLLTQSMVSRDLDTDEPYPLPFAAPVRGNGFHIPSIQLQSKMHLFLWRVRTICVTKALTAQSIPLTQDPFFTVWWDNSQTASELTNVTA